ncbi:MAG: NADH-ubiquinone oxidoreductase chain N, partial [uncultured Solirubrobacteraceae bacterium]
ERVRPRTRDRLRGALAAARAVRRRDDRAHARAVPLALSARGVRPVPGDRRVRRLHGPVDLAVGREHRDHLGRAARRRLRALPQPPVRRRRHRHRAAVVAGRRSARGGARRVLRDAPVLGRRHGRPRRRAEHRDALHRVRAALDPAVRAVRDRDAPLDVARVGAEVPDHRLGRLGHARLRAGVALRRHRLDRLLRDAHGDRRGRPRLGHAAARRDRARARRSRVQGVGRAVPPVDARRLRGRADADHRVHGRGHEGGRVRDPAAALRLRAHRRRADVGRRAGHPRDGDDHRRQRRRADADVAQAPARVVVGRPGRLPARRRRRRERDRPRGHALLPRGLHDHEPGRVRRDRRAPACDPRRQRSHRLGLGDRVHAPVARVAADDRDARAGGHPGDGRVHRQVRDHQRARRGRLHVARHRDRARLRGVAGLLPARRRRDVDAGGRPRVRLEGRARRVPPCARRWVLRARSARGPHDDRQRCRRRLGVRRAARRHRRGRALAARGRVRRRALRRRHRGDRDHPGAAVRARARRRRVLPRPHL